ncbi:MAG: glycosyltransferase [Gemmatimonadota bacterium]
MAESWITWGGALEAMLAAAVVVYALVVVWIRVGMGRGAASTGVGPAQPGPQVAAPGGQALPLVSVVIAARDEALHIGALLGDLAAQDYPRERYDVTVVDDGSQDGTAELVHRVGPGSPAPVRLVRAEGPGYGKKAALARGVAASPGEIILTTDGDCRVPPTWIRAMASAFAPRVGMVVGFSQTGAAGSARTWLGGWEATDFLHLMAAAMGSIGAGHPMAASGQNLAFRRAAYHEVGGYSKVLHRASGDDVLLLQLIRRTGRWGIRFCLDPGGYAIHPPCAGLGALLRQRARWASNGPAQLRLDPFFFVYLAAALALNGLLALTPVLWWSGAVAPAFLVAAWAAKVLPELAVHRAATAAFGRPDLGRYFPLWAVTQPWYVLVAGLSGAVGRFAWKGRTYARGVVPGADGRRQDLPGRDEEETVTAGASGHGMDA